MQQIAEWLEKLGMSEYAQRFAENGIDCRGPPRSHRSGPQGHRRPARASPQNAARRSPSLTVRRDRPAESLRLRLLQPKHRKIPQSAAKSR